MSWPLTYLPQQTHLSDAIIHTRITNDERALRRIVKKFHNYASLAHTPLLPPAHGGSVDDAREAFLVELASFELALKKSLMICEAESRQVEEYQRERHRIGTCLDSLDRFRNTSSPLEQEHDLLRSQISELKVALEHAQMERRRKMEYDSVAEKINTLPSRDELERYVFYGDSPLCCGVLKCVPFEVDSGTGERHGGDFVRA